MLPEPKHDLIGALVGRKHWIEDVLYSPAPNHQRQAFHQPHSGYLEGRQAHRVAQSEFSIAEDLEGKVQAAGHLTLIFGRLGAEAEHFGPKLQ